MPDKMTTDNTDLSLYQGFSQHLFWIHGGTWHIHFIGARMVVLEELSDARVQTLVEKLLRAGAGVDRCSRPFRSLWRISHYYGPIPQAGHSRNR